MLKKYLEGTNSYATNLQGLDRSGSFNILIISQVCGKTNTH